VGGLIDELMPEHDVREMHRVWVAAPCSRVWLELQQVTLREMPMFRVLLFLRGSPLRSSHRGRGSVSLTDRPLLAEMASGAFLPLAQRPPSELVLGLLARPWQLAAGHHHTYREGYTGFAAFAEPGWVKILIDFQLEEKDGRTRLTTETRAEATDGPSRWRFRLYWLVVGPGSALTRRALLRAVKRRAEAKETGPLG
jgi:hypothetical protein